MSFTYVQKVPSPEDIKAVVPMTGQLIQIKKERDQMIQDIFEDRLDRFIVIIGPCSADAEDSVCEYVARLQKLQERTADKLMIIPRVYTNKPRTTGEGYKGMLHQPDPESAPDLYEGILSMRKMHIRAMKESGLTPADEMLYPENLIYVDDVLSYVAIGARSVENQQHRLVSSGIDVPVGMKNPTSGNFSVMLNAITAAQSRHTFLYQGHEVQTTGNPLSHAILRGYVNKHGQSLPNYHYEDLLLLYNLYSNKGLANPSIIVDTNHANSNKKFAEQPRIVKEILHSRRYNPEIRKIVKGIMVESYLVEGAQDVSGGVYGKSITDPCLGWEATEKLLLETAEQV